MKLLLVLESLFQALTCQWLILQFYKNCLHFYAQLKFINTFQPYFRSQCHTKGPANKIQCSQSPIGEKLLPRPDLREKLLPRSDLESNFLFKLIVSLKTPAVHTHKTIECPPSPWVLNTCFVGQVHHAFQKHIIYFYSKEVCKHISNQQSVENKLQKNNSWWNLPLTSITDNNIWKEEKRNGISVNKGGNINLTFHNSHGVCKRLQHSTKWKV